jgi:YD repeat-containing protein
LNAVKARRVRSAKRCAAGRDPNGSAITTSYTPIGKVASVTDARGGQIAYT